MKVISGVAFDAGAGAVFAVIIVVGAVHAASFATYCRC